VTALLFGLTACNTSTQVAEGGIGGTGITTTGQITEFGSIWVNGIKFETDESVIYIEGEVDDGVDDYTQGDLGYCMVVTVTGIVNIDGISGKADIVEYADEIEGIVDVPGYDAVNKTLSVMDQTIDTSLFDSTKCFEGTGVNTQLSDLTGGEVVEVSGYSDGNGNIVATRIEVIEDVWDGEVVELKGEVDSHNSGVKTFKIGDLTIDYLGVVGAPVLSDGFYVEVKSTSAITGTYPNRVMTASAIEIEDEEGVWSFEEGEEIELEGEITVIPNPAEIVLNGQQIDVSQAPTYVGGTSANLIVGALVSVHCDYSGGTLIATEIEFH